jgi:hypothetical protein
MDAIGELAPNITTLKKKTEQLDERVTKLERLPKIS